MLSKEIELEAETILNKLNIKTLPIPVEKLAAKLDIQIRRGPSKEFSGLLLRKENTAFIGLNSEESSVRQRFTIAHELGHYFLHQNKDVFVEYRDNKHDIIREPKEMEANTFAAALLMPKLSIEKDFKNMVKDVFQELHLKLLASKYEVSEDAMKYRLVNLSFLD